MLLKENLFGDRYINRIALYENENEELKRDNQILINENERLKNENEHLGEKNRRIISENEKIKGEKQSLINVNEHLMDENKNLKQQMIDNRKRGSAKIIEKIKSLSKHNNKQTMIMNL
ncbi:27758_t:CDS:2 [Dentiscutata erythropus]|uniref:27758_t:CDS:1 n=1 Tax=Dentiscutata erythropus TaxID=1348616 RepID=A0A9N9FCQ4_9GLOM|nr:27758_t:CDS:2 [Dentiscutata erythropus]